MIKFIYKKGQAEQQLCYAHCFNNEHPRYKRIENVFLLK